MTKIARSAAVLLALAAPARQASASPIVVTGVGTATCAVFAMHYKGDPKFAYELYTSWAQGFMGGLNIAARSARDLGSLTTEEHAASFREFCDEHPLLTFMESVMRHYDTLPIVEKPLSLLRDH